MSIKKKKRYVCQVCGAEFPKWYGKCPSCGAWNSIIEVEEETTKNVTQIKPITDNLRNKVFELSEIKEIRLERIKTGIKELDRVLGGGFVPGSIVLLAGDPGIGKSTLSLQAALSVKKKVLYVSGEESLEQIKLRTLRLEIEHSDNVFFVSEILLENIFSIIEDLKPDLVIIDSIQTIVSETLDSAAGSVSQVRECASRIQRFAKKSKIVFLLIGHITKEGQVAGPKVLEHIVDTVLQFEGDTNNYVRIIRALKNRFGSTNEIGVFEMTDKGLKEVKNPSILWLSGSNEPVSGVAVGTVMEGLRPIFIEVQSLVTSSVYGTPQRGAIGFDSKRLNMLIAVLEKRLGIKLANKDVFLNIAGGLKVDDPSVDLAVVASLLSSYLDLPLPKDIVFIGEISLTGEIRPVINFDKRLKEVAKLGYKKLIYSKFSKQILNASEVELIPLKKVAELYALINSLR